ncbi:hypothetical protein KJ359_004198 [Pestalotiopsis sp. 9143b]|nr:hypothetical protein KJ359_004198 [Pestalotiopsis sp. 9143b]
MPDAAKKPTVVLVPGAWLPASAYAAWTARLEQDGHRTATTPYPSSDPSGDAHDLDVAGDAAAVRAALLRLLDDEDHGDVVLVMHSYGGMPGSSAAAGLPRILGLVYVAAFVVPEGTSCAGMTGGRLAPWVRDDTPRAGVNMPADPANMFRHGFAAGEAARLGASCRPHATRAFTSAQPPSALGAGDAWRGRLAYVKTARDDEIPQAAQDAMIGGADRDWVVRSVDGGHMSPFGGDYLEESVAILAEMIEAFSLARSK